MLPWPGQHAAITRFKAAVPDRRTSLLQLRLGRDLHHQKFLEQTKTLDVATNEKALENKFQSTGVWHGGTMTAKDHRGSDGPRLMPPPLHSRKTARSSTQDRSVISGIGPGLAEISRATRVASPRMRPSRRRHPGAFRSPACCGRLRSCSSSPRPGTSPPTSSAFSGSPRSGPSRALGSGSCSALPGRSCSARRPSAPAGAYMYGAIAKTCPAPRASGRGERSGRRRRRARRLPGAACADTTSRSPRWPWRC